MKETFNYYIDTIVFSAMTFLTIKLLTYFQVSFNYGYAIGGCLILFVIGKMTMKKLVNKSENS